MKNKFRSISKIALVLIYFVIVAGAIVRMTGSGMGCPDWPKCFGYYIPPSEESELIFKSNHDYKSNQMIILNNEKLYTAKSDFRSSNEINLNNWIIYEKHNYVTYNPVHTWIEFINRLIGAVAGIFTLLMLIMSLKYWKENKIYKITSKEFNFLSVQYLLFSDLQDLYMDFGDIKSSQYYQKLQDANRYEQEKHLRGYAINRNVDIVERNSRYSDSLSNLSYLIIQKFENNSAVDIDLDDVYNKLNTDLNRNDIILDDKLELLKILRYICLKSENHVQQKVFLQQELIIRDSLNLWTDSLKISNMISMAYVENALFAPQSGINILEQLKSEFGVDKIMKYNSYTRVINNLSYYYSEIGDYIQSKNLLEIELSRLNSLLQNSNKEQLDLINKDKMLTLNNLGETSLSLKEVKNAHQYLKEAFEISKKYYVSNSMNYFQQLKNYADLLMFSEYQIEAENLLKEESELAKELFSKRDFEYYISQKQLFMFYFLHERYDICDTRYQELVNQFLFTFFD